MNRSRRSLLALAAFLALPGAAASAQDGMTAVYAFTWAGLDVGRFEVELEASGTSYRAVWVGRHGGHGGHALPLRLGRHGRRSARGRPVPAHAFRRPQRMARRRQPVAGRVRAGRACGRRRGAGRGPGRSRAGSGGTAGRARPGLPRAGRDLPRRTRASASTAGASTAGAPCTSNSPAPRATPHPSSPAPSPAGCSPAPRAGGASAREASRRASRSGSGCAPGVHGDGFWPVRLEAPSRFGTVEARLISIDRLPAAG